MAYPIQRYGFSIMCLSAWIVISYNLAPLFPAQGDSAVLSGSQRFIAAFDGAAVKDLQTGFTWEQSPDFSYSVWTEAIAHCKAKTVGGQTGWRLPSIKELSTLIDSSQKDPALPSGHPFGNNKSSIFWSSTPSETDDMVAWHVSFFTGEAVTDQKSQTRRTWCMLAETATPRP
jgi:hypothetical protein